MIMAVMLHVMRTSLALRVTWTFLLLLTMVEVAAVKLICMGKDIDGNHEPTMLFSPKKFMYSISEGIKLTMPNSSHPTISTPSPPVERKRERPGPRQDNFGSSRCEETHRLSIIVSPDSIS